MYDHINEPPPTLRVLQGNGSGRIMRGKPPFFKRTIKFFSATLLFIGVLVFFAFLVMILSGCSTTQNQSPPKEVPTTKKEMEKPPTNKKGRVVPPNLNDYVNTQIMMHLIRMVQLEYQANRKIIDCYSLESCKQQIRDSELVELLGNHGSLEVRTVGIFKANGQELGRIFIIRYDRPGGSHPLAHTFRVIRNPPTCPQGVTGSDA